jgi:hypothetical protein
MCAQFEDAEYRYSYKSMKHHRVPTFLSRHGDPPGKKQGIEKFILRFRWTCAVPAFLVLSNVAMMAENEVQACLINTPGKFDLPTAGKNTMIKKKICMWGHLG